MGVSSLTKIGLMFMVNFLLICNYFFIRKLRDTVDRCVKENNERYLQQLQEFKEHLGLSQHEEKEIESSVEQPMVRFSCNIFNIICACVFGRPTKTTCVATRFPSWQPIPFNLGVLSTTGVLVTAIFLLSDELLHNKVAVDVSRESSTGFCETGNANITAFEDYIKKNITNFHVASRQRNQTILFRDALVNDTKLYGTGHKKCMGETQETYRKKGMDIKHGEFFPGYCEEHLFLQVERALKRECPTTEYCMSDLCDGWQCDVATTTYNECKDIPTICDDRERFLEKAMNKLRHHHDNKIEKRSRNQEGIAIQNVETLDDGDLKRSTETIDNVLKQVDIAGTLYCFYVLIALFFPSPLQLFRSPFSTRIKQLIFGFNKVSFIVITLIIWWGYQFLIILSNIPEFRIYLTSIIADPCLIDGDFISARVDAVQNICKNLLQREHEWGLAIAEINEIKPAIDSWYSDCDCEFIDTHVLPLFISIEEAKELHFDNHWDYLGPKVNSTFLGNGTICLDTKYARDEILIADESSLSYWELWVTSGLLAGLFVKVAISNFGISLLKLADPFFSCEGTYESPPCLNQKNNQGRVNAFIVDEKVKQDKATELRAIATRDCVTWGFIANTCLLTLFVTAWSNLGEYDSTDYVLFTIVMLICASLPICCFSITRYTNDLVSDKFQKEEDNFVSVKLQKDHIIEDINKDEPNKV